MGVVLGAVVLKDSDTRRAARFWGQALGYTPDPDNPDFLTAKDGGGPRLHLDTGDRTRGPMAGPHRLRPA